jgi:hypothetical protein
MVGFVNRYLIQLLVKDFWAITTYVGIGLGVLEIRWGHDDILVLVELHHLVKDWGTH